MIHNSHGAIIKICNLVTKNWVYAQGGFAPELTVVGFDVEGEVLNQMVCQGTAANFIF